MGRSSKWHGNEHGFLGGKHKYHKFTSKFIQVTLSFPLSWDGGLLKVQNKQVSKSWQEFKKFNSERVNFVVV